VYRVVIDSSLCIGYGACAELAPDVFTIGPEGNANVRIGSTDDPGALEAAATCPMDAITVVEEEAA
jgi:ferredoxin